MSTVGKQKMDDNQKPEDQQWLIKASDRNIFVLAKFKKG